MFPPSGAFLLRGRKRCGVPYFHYARIIPKFWLPGNSELPVTLFINFESRKETKRHYGIACIDYSFQALWPLSTLMTTRSPPVCFNPSRDVTFLNFKRFLHGHFRAFGSGDLIPKSRAVRTLALFYIELHWGTTGIWDFKRKEPITKGLQTFTELEKVWLVGKKHGHWEDNAMRKNLEDIKMLLKLCFEWQNMKSGRCGVPNIIVFEDIKDALEEIPGGGLLAQRSSMVKRKIEWYSS
jgi:hypothetical protein